ncbi:MAG TPA: alanine racemase [Bacillales bacterium]|nr:alanine racemase [Bacillales bacterium]
MDTPAIVIDHSKLMHNIKKTADMARKKGVHLRPHVKTHKIPYIARKQVEAGAVGITVAKVTAAEVMADHGIDDIFVAYPLVTEQKIQKAIALNDRIRLIVAADSLTGAKLLSSAAEERNTTLEVWLEVDTGLRRTGVPYDQAVELAKQINALPNLYLAGIYTFRGPLLNGESTLRLQEAGEEEGRIMVALAEQIRKEGIAIRDVSVGSTQTSAYAAEVPGVTEVRPGTNVFNDAMQISYGCCTEEECAATVRATVVSRPYEELAIVDGGSKTFATDVQPGEPPINLNGYGKVVGHTNVAFKGMKEEHGILHIDGETDLKIGDVVEIIPNHICSTVNLHNEVWIKDENGRYEAYPVLARGKLQ